METKNVAIICIALLMAYALCLGFDGVLLAGVLAGIASIAGYNIRLIREKRENG